LLVCNEMLCEIIKMKLIIRCSGDFHYKRRPLAFICLQPAVRNTKKDNEQMST
jgi:hypothetical protein